VVRTVLLLYCIILYRGDSAVIVCASRVRALGRHKTRVSASGKTPGGTRICVDSAFFLYEEKWDSGKVLRGVLCQAFEERNPTKSLFDTTSKNDSHFRPVTKSLLLEKEK
jgi:hypothetical protein